MSKPMLNRLFRRLLGDAKTAMGELGVSRGRKARARTTAGRFAILEELENRNLLSVAIQFDYSLDTNGFFLQQSRRDLLQSAADALASQFQDTLTAVTPGGGNSYSFDIFNPATVTDISIDNLAVPADTIIIYAGGNVLGGSILGLGGPAGYSDITGSQTFIDAVLGRGQAGAVASPATDFAPVGGAITFDTTTNWFFGASSSGLGAAQIDFYSVAIHELGHALGIGTSESWLNLITGTTFTGTQSKIANNGVSPSVTSDGGHWASGTTSNGQEAAMTPSIGAGERRSFSPLDYAGLKDLGWDLAPGVDFVAPSVTIEEGSQGDVATSTPIYFDVVFSEPITGFSGSDISFTGSTAPGTLSASVVGQGDGMHYTVLVSGMTGSGNVVASIPASRVVDNAGNNNTASTSVDNIVFFDSTAFTVTIDKATGQEDPTDGSVVFDVVFNHVTSDFEASDVSFAGSTATGSLVAHVSALGDGMHYTVNVTGMIGSGTIVASIPAGIAIDSNNRANNASTSVDNIVEYDVTPPVVTINQAVTQLDPTNSNTIYYTVIFSEAVSGFTNTDILFTGSTAANISDLDAEVTGSGAEYTVAVTGMTQSGVVILTIPASAVVDAAGNANFASTSSDNQVSYDITRPTVTINQDVAQADPTNISSIDFLAIFSEPVTSFYASGISFAGSTVGGTPVASITSLDNGLTFKITVTGMTSSGTLVVSLPAGAALDAAFNPSFASTSTDNSVVYDIVRPTVTLSSTAPGYTTLSSIPVTVTFTKPVSGFSAGDLLLGNATVSGFAGSGTNYSFNLIPTAEGTVTVSVPDSSGFDIAGNGNTESQTLARVHDITRPTVTIDQATSQPDADYPGPVVFTVAFSETITEFSSTDILLSGSAVPVNPTISISGDGPVYTVTVFGVNQVGTISATLAANSTADLAGNLNTAATSTDNTVTIINPNPTISGFDKSAGRVAVGNEVTLSVSSFTSGQFPIAFVNFYRDSNGDGILQPEADTLVGTDTSASGGWSINADTSLLALGNAVYFARADDDHDRVSNVLTTNITTVRAEHATNGKATYIDSAGRTVNVSIVGGGSFDLEYVNSADPDAINVIGSTHRTTLTVSTRAGTTTNIGQIIVGNINSSLDHTFIKAINAAGVNLTSGLTITGSTTTAKFADLTNANVTIGAGLTPTSTLALTFDEIINSNIQSQTAISTFKATDWRDTDATRDAITAPWIQTLQITGRTGVRGDFGADINLTSGIVATSLGTFTVAGELAGSVLRAVNGVGTVRVGSMIDSSIYSGFRSTVTGLPFGTDFASVTHSFVKSFTVVSTASNAFARSNVAAAKLGKIKLTVVNVFNNGTPFGLASVTTDTYSGPAAGLDYTIRRVVPPLGGAAA